MAPANRKRIFFRHYYLTSCCFRKKSKSTDEISPDDKYSMLVKKGREVINKDLSIEKLIKTLRDIKIFMKKKLLDEETKFEI